MCKENNEVVRNYIKDESRSLIIGSERSWQQTVSLTPAAEVKSSGGNLDLIVGNEMNIKRGKSINDTLAIAVAVLMRLGQ